MNRAVLMLTGLVLAGMAQQAAAKPETVERTFEGIRLVGVPAEPGVDYGIKLVSPRRGLKNLRKAFELIHKKSSFSVAAIDTLKENGNVIVIYSPRLPQTKGGSLLAAVFLPDYFKRGGGARDEKNFVVVVGALAIKWPTPKLAMVLVHELVGHGMQQLRGRMDYIRELDLECAANLYGEKFYQDVGIDKKSREVIEFRQALEKHWCSDFKRYMREKTPSLIKLWDVLNPDVPRLLEAFDGYADDLRDGGVSGNAVKAAHKMQRAKFKKWARQVASTGTAEEQHQLAVAYRDGLGTPRDHAAAAKWFGKAAARGFAPAQTNLGTMYAKGRGVPRDLARARTWWRRAAQQGDADAQYDLGLFYAKDRGRPAQSVLAHMWLSLAAPRLPNAKRANAEKVLGAIQKRMTAAHIDEARRLAGEWRPKGKETE
ncbi:MAG: tetratricopeptide repeat protein [Rhodospirillales bacterium]|nr:tetratricopeptide repeat protein [Rhodospirillales bacterium]